MRGLDDLLADHPREVETLYAFADRLRFYNQRLNLIARTDAARIVEHHILHCLALAGRSFHPVDRVVDWGTGGGLPLIPLAVMFPDTEFIGVDSVEKKTQAVAQIARELGLANVQLWHGRAEAFAFAHTHSVSRATAPVATLWGWHTRNAVRPAQPSGPDTWKPGLICLKGGDLQSELASLPERTRVHAEPVGFGDPYYQDKYIVTVEQAVCAG